jgi:hypothetical protein
LLITIQLVIFWPASWWNSVPLCQVLPVPVCDVRCRLPSPVSFHYTNSVYKTVSILRSSLFALCSLCQMLPHELCVTKQLHVKVLATVHRCVRTWSER